MTTTHHIHSGCKVAVIGLGISGRAAVRYALARGAEVRVSDTRPSAEFEKVEAQFLQETGVEFEAGGHSLGFLQNSELAIVSPGIDLDMPLIHDLKRAGARITGELGVVAGDLDIPVIAVTGTNGKTTVTTLIGEILAGSGKKVFVGGNIGTPLYEYALGSEKFDFIVAELSSFQLENMGDFSPHVGVLLNISPDHLNRHRTMENYVAAKMNLFVNQKETDFAVVNGDDSFSQNLDPEFLAHFTSFGSGSYNDVIIEDNKFIFGKSGEQGAIEIATTGLTSGFQAQNYAAALLALQAVGCSSEQVVQGLKDFCPLPHRLELVGESAGVSFYNDSKATNTGAVVGALANFESPVILIAGGRDKGDDYSLLATSVKKKVKRLVVIGEAADLLEAALGDVVETVGAVSMEEAVRLAMAVAKPGDVVLLSPACASFDMFSGYAERGRVFTNTVQQLCQ